MRASHISALALATVMALGGSTPVPSTTSLAPRKQKHADPYHGIKSKGRTGARARQAAMAEAFAGTKVGKRNARGRALGWISKTVMRKSA